MNAVLIPKGSKLRGFSSSEREALYRGKVRRFTFVCMSMWDGIRQSLSAFCRSNAANIWGDTRGAATTEYIVLVSAVGLGSAVAVLWIGYALVSSFQFIRYLLLFPFP
jgi:hypothetical protein